MLLIAGCILIVGMSCQLAARVMGVETAPTLPPAVTVPVVEATEEQPQPLQEATEPTATEQAEPAQEQDQAEADTPEPETEAVLSGFEDCQEEVCYLEGYYPFIRPVGEPGRVIYDHANEYAMYRRSTGDSYHGVFFLNSTGTPVVAAAEGTVVVAGDDLQRKYGAFVNMYGNLVILEHNLAGISEPVYTLYAHLSQVRVSPDDVVQAGDVIGEVGSSGSVTGSTLYFEIRVGENEYASVRNPELWLQPVPGEDGQLMGALAGRIVDENGDYIRIDNIVLEQLGGPEQPVVDQLYLKTYAESRLTGDSPYRENFARGDLPAGNYQVSFWLNGMQQKEIEIRPGGLTSITFTIR
jgi:murein DD-endopeptidase MepM/ murein hydrolase activator NlpD